MAPRCAAPKVSACSAWRNDEQSEPGLGREPDPADDSRDGADRQQPGRPQPRGEPAAKREQDDLGKHALGPEQADHVVLDPRCAPGQRREAVGGGVARLDQRGGDQEHDHRRIGQQGRDRHAVARRRRSGLRHRRGRQHGQRERAEDQPEDRLGAGTADKPAAGDRADDEGDRPPQPDPGVVEPAVAAGQQGHVLAHRDDRGEGDGGEDADGEQRREPLRDQEQEMDREGRAGEQDQDCAPPPPAVGEMGGDRRRGDAHPGAGGDQQPDLGRAQPLRCQPYRPERQRYTDEQKHRRVEESQAYRHRRSRYPNSLARSELL